MYICTRRSHVLSPLAEAAIGPKGRSITWNDNMEVLLCEFNVVVYAETLLNYTDWTIPFTIYTDSSGKQLGGVISQNDQPTALFLRKLSKPQHNYTITEK